MYEDVVLSTRIKADDWRVIGETLEDYLARQAGLCKVLKTPEEVELRVWIYTVDMAKMMKEIVGLTKAAGIRTAPAFKTRKA